MSLKLTGAEMNAFMVDPAIWTEGRWYDDLYAEVDGEPHDLDLDFHKDLPPADAKVYVESGALYRSSEINAVFDDFEKVLRRWLKARTVTVLTLEVPNGDVPAFRDEMRAKGWRVLP